MRHGSLFSGGGGFDLAAEMVGWQNVFHCEKDKFCQRILKHYWSKAETFTDIKEFNAEKYKGKIDIITGGFPCQPFSAAGKRRGTADDRYLWPDMLRIIQQVQPSWVVGENVYGLINWQEGLVFDKVQSDLEAQGYEVAAFVLPATAINAPHQRYRVWVVAYHPEYAAQRSSQTHSDTDSIRRKLTVTCRNIAKGRKRGQCQHIDCLCTSEQSQIDTAKLPCSIPQKIIRLAGKDWRDWPTQSPLCCRDDGLPTELDGIAFRKWRTQSIKMYGNAIVPQVAMRIFKTIQAYEAQK